MEAQRRGHQLRLEKSKRGTRVEVILELGYQNHLLCQVDQEEWTYTNDRGQDMWYIKNHGEQSLGPQYAEGK